MWLNIGCGPYPAPAPWVNVDVVRAHNIQPDILAPSWEPSSFGIDPSTVERVYLGHVLEHVAWPHVPTFLAQVRDLMASGGQVCVVGPDTNRTLQLWRDGSTDWSLVMAVLEDDTHYQSTPEMWDGARHAWNCYEARVVRALTDAGFEHVTPHPVVRDAPLVHWPVVAYTNWQCAAIGTAP